MSNTQDVTFAADLHELRKWLNEQPNRDIDREALARVLAAVGVDEPLTTREIELLNGMIEVQLHHAAQCDSIANRRMAEKQKAWDMERVTLLRKLKGDLLVAANKMVCTWTQVDDEHTPDTWQGSCGAVWSFIDGGPADNGQRFCPKCGAECKEVRGAE
jgi:hypothetical protein